MTQVWHGGWAQEEQERLWTEVSRAAKERRPLRSAFERFAQDTGRRPNSVRNYYYTAIKAGAERPEDMEDVHTFTPFTRAQVDALLEEVLMALGEGESVRACVLRMGGGDRALSLRYQNKYRSILKSHPEWIQETLRRLQERGIPTVDPFSKMRARRLPATQREESQSASALLEAIGRLVNHSENIRRKQREELDRMQVRCDLLRIELAQREEQLMAASAQRVAMLSALEKARMVLRLYANWMEFGQEEALPDPEMLRQAVQALGQACVEVDAEG